MVAADAHRRCPVVRVGQLSDGGNTLGIHNKILTAAAGLSAIYFTPSRSRVASSQEGDQIMAWAPEFSCQVIELIFILYCMSIGVRAIYLFYFSSIGLAGKFNGM